MDTTTLVGFPLEAGQKLLDRLDEAGIFLSVAFWEWSEFHGEWRLVLSSPEVGVKGPLFFVKAIHQILDQMTEEEQDGLSVREIAVLGFNRLRLKEMRRRYAPFMAYGAKGVVPLQNAHQAYEQKEPLIYRLA